jgi:hypothetical protein
VRGRDVFPADISELRRLHVVVDTLFECPLGLSQGIKELEVAQNEG